MNFWIDWSVLVVLKGRIAVVVVVVVMLLLLVWKVVTKISSSFQEEQLNLESKENVNQDQEIIKTDVRAIWYIYLFTNFQLKRS